MKGNYVVPSHKVKHGGRRSGVPVPVHGYKCTIVIHLVFGSNVSHVSHVSGTYSVTGVYEVSPVIMGDPRPSY